MSHPPETPSEPVHEIRFGVDVADPFRWLEADLRDDVLVREWASRQSAHTAAWLADLPERETIRAHLRSTWSFEKLSAPLRCGDRLFHEWNSGRLRHAVVVMQQGLDGVPTTLLDPNAMDPEDGDVVRDWQPTRDGTRLAYTVQRHGGDWRCLRFLDVDPVQPIADQLFGLKAGQFAWHPDNDSIYYTSFAAPGGARADASSPVAAVYYHRLGEAQSTDRLILQGDGGALALYTPAVSDDGRWLVITSSNASGTSAEVRVQRLMPADSSLQQLATSGSRWHFLGGADDRLFFVTDRDAPRGRIVALDPTRASEQQAVTVVPETAHAIRSATLAGDELVVQYLEGITGTLRRFARDGLAIGSIAVPALCVADHLRGDANLPELFYRVSSMVQAPAIYRCDLETGAVSLYRAPVVPWDPTVFTIEQITVTSADGTLVPVTLAHRSEPAGHNPRPTLLMVYGGFGVSPDLGFWESRFGWIAMGGVFAIAHTRGGAEFGSEWAAASRKAGRLRVIEDYLAAASALCERGVTQVRRLVALGASNGGLMVAAAANEAPDRFAAVLCRVPLTDLLRYPRFTLGLIWIDELGDPDVEEDFHVLRSYSPLHNVKHGVRYPAILVTTADADDRVVPSHSFKYIATLQSADIGPAPHLLRLEHDAGHGEGKSADQLIEEFTDLWAFAAAHSGLEVPAASN